jgi:RimJ/RimL family protein N-acetyltransferase
MTLRIASVAAGLASVLLLGASQSWAGAPVPAPLVGVAGPFGIVAAGVAYGGYLLVRRYRNRG